MEGFHRRYKGVAQGAPRLWAQMVAWLEISMLVPWCQWARRSRRGGAIADFFDRGVAGLRHRPAWAGRPTACRPDGTPARRGASRPDPAYGVQSARRSCRPPRTGRIDARHRRSSRPRRSACSHPDDHAVRFPRFRSDPRGCRSGAPSPGRQVTWPYVAFGVSWHLPGAWRRTVGGAAGAALQRNWPRLAVGRRPARTVRSAWFMSKNRLQRPSAVREQLSN